MLFGFCVIYARCQTDMGGGGYTENFGQSENIIKLFISLPKITTVKTLFWISFQPSLAFIDIIIGVGVSSYKLVCQ